MNVLELAQDLVMEIDGVRVSGPAVRGRSCGTCTACCTQVPVELPSGVKPANERCPHLCSKGCRVYDHRPDPCRAWSCRWLFDEGTSELRRPDQSGVVIDCMPDTIVATDGETGEKHPIGVIQVWCDPKRRDAHRDPALRRYLAKLTREHAMAVIVRWSSGEGVVLVPPHMTRTGEWGEKDSQVKSSAEMVETLAEAGVDSPVHRAAARRERGR